MISQLLFESLPKYVKHKFQSYSESNPLEYNDLIVSNGFNSYYNNDPSHDEWFSIFTRTGIELKFLTHTSFIDYVNNSNMQRKLYEIHQQYNGLVNAWKTKWIKDNMQEINFYLNDCFLKDDFFKQYFTTELIEKFLPIIGATISEDKKIITLK